MAGLAPVELTVDCDVCRLESGVVEIYDALVPACRFGLPATTRCRMCSMERRSTFDGASTTPLREVPANRCPACLEELSTSAVDERRCPHCGARAALEALSSPRLFATLEELELALDRWAEREAFPSREALLAATFVERDVARIFAAIQRQERIEVLADPFANMGVRTTGRGPEGPSRNAPSPAVMAPAVGVVARAPTDERAAGALTVDASSSLAPSEDVASRTTSSPLHVEALRDVAPSPLASPATPSSSAASSGPLASPATPPSSVASPSPTRAPPPSAPPRAIVYPLVSVIAADGEVHPEERELVDRFLLGEGLAPLADDEFCVHHPSEVAHFVPRERREDVVKLMCETAAIDGLPDESERRVIRAYATAWGVDDEKLEFWMWGYETMNTSLVRQLFLKLRRFVLSARWAADDSP